MRNLTISIDDETLEAGRQYAQQRGMSLNTLIRQLLTRTVTKSSDAWLDECFQLMDQAGGDSHGRRWTREDLYDV